jgi:eukaryotic-like serine/threonine-protein kinase
MGTLLDGRYRLTEEISRGELGTVWRCVVAAIGRTAAVKVLQRGLADDPTTLKRIRLGWARPMAKITHSDVIPILDVGVDPEAGVYVLMHYVEGESLRELLAREDRLAPDRAMDLVARIADAFEALHAWGIVHRDLGPSKVLVRPDATVALTPFGLVYQLSGPTAPYVSQGRARYLSPEQIMGQAVTQRSDIFSLGVLAYRCLTGRIPFDGESTLEVALHIVQSEPAPLPPDVPAAVRSIVERALAKDPAARWPTAAEFAGAARRA